tara:strand:- start:594 stop:986 length:393 start_codon:yes stop_codon:yes gene_type:complete
MKKNTKGAAQIKTTIADNASLLHKSKTIGKTLAAVATGVAGGYGLSGNLLPAAAVATGWMGQDMIKTFIKRKSERPPLTSPTPIDPPSTSSNQTPNSTPENDAKVQKKFDDTYMKSGSPKMINKLRNIGK